jgi:hypothetical protein
MTQLASKLHGICRSANPWWTPEKQKSFKKKKSVALEGIELQSLAWKSNA